MVDTNPSVIFKPIPKGNVTIEIKNPPRYFVPIQTRDTEIKEMFTVKTQLPPKEEKTTEISMEKAFLLANLLSKETKAVWGADISQERKELEHALGIETEFFVRHIPLVYGIFSLGGLVIGFIIYKKAMGWAINKFNLKDKLLDDVTSHYIKKDENEEKLR